MKLKGLILILTVLVTNCISQTEEKVRVPISKVEIGRPIQTNAPNGPLFGTIMCDSSNSIYLRYFPVGERGLFGQHRLAKISNSGQFSIMDLANVPGIPDSSEVFFIAVAQNGMIYALLQPLPTATVKNPSVYFATFSNSGNYVSSYALHEHVFPNFLVPLPDGGLFIGGTKIEKSANKLPFVGFFSSDGNLRLAFKRPNPGLTEAQKAEGTVDPAIHYGSASVGPDGNIYMLLATDPATVQVFSPAGELIREFSPKTPFEHGSVSGLFAAPGRILLPYYGKDATGNSIVRWNVYSADSGELLRSYEPTGESGQPACWEDGKRLKFLVVDPSTSMFSIASAEVQ